MVVHLPLPRVRHRCGWNHGPGWRWAGFLEHGGAEVHVLCAPLRLFFEHPVDLLVVNAGRARRRRDGPRTQASGQAHAVNGGGIAATPEDSAGLLPDALGVSRPVHARPPAASGLLNKATEVPAHGPVAVVYDRQSALQERRYKPPIGRVDLPLLKHYARRAFGTPAPATRLTDTCGHGATL
jgi:hypothetical protein